MHAHLPRLTELLWASRNHAWSPGLTEMLQNLMESLQKLTVKRKMCHSNTSISVARGLGGLTLQWGFFSSRGESQIIILRLNFSEEIGLKKNIYNHTINAQRLCMSPGSEPLSAFLLCQHIADAVTDDMHRLHAIFLERNPRFSGAISVAGHSLGKRTSCRFCLAIPLGFFHYKKLYCLCHVYANSLA